MRDYQRNQLRKELHAVGANSDELESLLPIANNLDLLKDSSPTNVAQGRSWVWLVKPAAIGLVGLCVGMLLVIMSQAASPTGRLYPIQKFSDAVAIDIHPAYRASVMMKRAQQVNVLVAQGANSRVVLATLADYTREAGAYEHNSHANYAAFEYCKSNLEQAVVMATPAVRSAIEQSLESLQSV
jgi:hypothetical protein